jgi:hypothetical protein
MNRSIRIQAGCVQYVRYGSFASFPRCLNYVSLYSETGDKADIARAHLSPERTKDVAHLSYLANAHVRATRMKTKERAKNKFW